MKKISIILFLFALCFVLTHARASPKVSIITSIYNGDEFIRGYLEDIIRQSVFPNAEVILVNANSPGNEESVINEYLAHYPNIRYFKLESDPGLYAVYNFAIEQALSEFIAVAELDDRRNPESLEQQLILLQNHPEIDLIYQDYFITTTPNEIWEHHHGYPVTVPEYSLKKMHLCLPGPQPVWRKNMHEKFGKFNEKYRFFGDYEFWCRAASKGSQFKKDSDYSGLYYLNPKGLKTNKEDPRIVDLRKMEIDQIVDLYIRFWAWETSDVLEPFIAERFFGKERDQYYLDLRSQKPKHSYLDTCGWKVRKKDVDYLAIDRDLLSVTDLNNPWLKVLSIFYSDTNVPLDEFIEAHHFHYVTAIEKNRIYVKDSHMNRLIKNRALKYPGYGTHIFPLLTVLSHTDGPILEIGSGDYSTPVLHAICSGDKRYILTVDTNQEWLDSFVDLSRSWHQFKYLQPADYKSGLENRKNWSVVFVNGISIKSRLENIKNLRNNADTFVIHDAENFPSEHDSYISTFTYRYLYDRYTPHTLIISDKVDVSAFFE